MTYLEHDPKPVWSTWELENIYEWMQDLVKGGPKFYQCSAKKLHKWSQS